MGRDSGEGSEAGRGDSAPHAVSRRALLRRAGAWVASAGLAGAGLGAVATDASAAEGGAKDPKSRGVEAATAEMLAKARARIAYHRRTAFAPLLQTGKLTEARADPGPDEKRAAACTRYAAYLVANDPMLERRQKGDLQIPGATPDEAAALRYPFIVGTEDPRLAVDIMVMGGVWRLSLLDPAWTNLSYGGAWKKGGWEKISIVVPGPEREDVYLDEPVLYPAPGQEDVPLEYSPSSGDVVPYKPGEPGTAGGFPVSAFLFGTTLPRNAEASLLDARGKKVECALCAPGTPPAAGAYQYPNAVFLVPKAPLRKKETYTARMAADLFRPGGDRPEGPQALGRWEKEWKFQTAAKATDFSGMGHTVFR